MNLPTITSLDELKALHGKDELRGFYSMPEALYHSCGLGLSQTQLKDFHRSPRHYRQALETPKATSDDMARGTALHCLVLDGAAEFDARFTVAPDEPDLSEHGHPNSKAYRAAKAAWRAEAAAATAGKTVVAQKTIDQVLGMARALGEAPLAAGFLGMRAMREVSLFWKLGGVLCRSRLDLADDRGMIVDLKTTFDARAASFAQSVAKYRYDWQFAFYSIGYEMLTGVKVTDCVWLVVEAESPHGVAAYRLGDDDLKLARVEVTRAVADFGQCQREDRWPSYPDVIQDIFMPAWMRRT